MFVAFCVRGNMRRIIGLFVDLLLIAAATTAAVILRDNLEVSLDHVKATLPYTVSTLAVAAVTLVLFGVHRVLWRFSTLNDYLRLVAATIVIVAGACVCSFVFNRLDAVPRTLPLLQGMLIAALLISVRVSSRIRYSTSTTSAGALPAQRMPTVTGAASTVLVVGLTRLTDLYIRSAAEFAPRAVRIAGLLGQKEKFTGSSVHQHTVLGTPEDVSAVVRNLEVHGVFVDSIVVAKRFETLSDQAQQALLQIEASTSIRLVFLAETLGFEDGVGRRPPDTGEHAPGPQGATTSAAFSYTDKAIDDLNARPYWRIKRFIDIAVASVMLVAAAPIMISIALLVLLDIGSPVTFWQQRPGRGGRPIHLYKFRTMGSAHDSKGRRIPDDQRISIIGRFLRRTRLDELPQLFSIISGDMSFVGPRPLLPVDQSPEHAARLLVPPGLTGWAQVNGGREVSAADKAALDVWYVQNASLLLDLRIVLRTIPMVLFGERISPHDIQRAWLELQQQGICPAGASSGHVSHPSDLALKRVA